MKKFLIITSLFISVAVNATNYYVKSTGNNSNTGQSDVQAWATVEKVVSTISAGDSVFFNRGNVWREDITPKAGTSGSHTYYGAYGIGVKPRFLGSVTTNSGWTEVITNIWQNSNAAFTIDVGNLIFNNEASCGVKIMSATPTLDAQGEFWYDFVNDRIRMYSIGNPASVYTNIECALRRNAIYSSSASYITYQNLDFRYWGACVIEDIGNYINFLDLDISYIGGGDQLGDYTIRYGNGLQIWCGHHDITIERCRIDNVYDAGITPQGDGGGYEVCNIYMRNNVISNCEYSFEFWERDATTSAHDIYFENNTCLNAGGGWGHNQRPDGAMGCHFQAYTSTATISDIYIRNNIFYESTENLIRFWNAGNVAFYTLDYNDLYQSTGNIGTIVSTGYATIGDWRTATSQEVNSIDDDPLFVSSSDFHLQTGSPAIDAGIDAGLPYSGNAPDIGAFETQPVTSATIPVYTSSVVENATPARLEMTYNVTLANAIPAGTAFTVQVNGVNRNVSSVSILDNKVRLTVASAVVFGDKVTVSYNKSASNWLQTTSGGAAASITSQSVTNNCLEITRQNNPPIPVIKNETSSYSGFVGEIDASGSYDLNNDILTYEWIVPDNVSVSSTSSSKIQFLAPVVTTARHFEFQLKVTDGKVIVSRSIPINIMPYKPELTEARITNIEASSYNTPDYPDNITDGNTATKWSVNGDNQWILLKLAEPFEISHLEIAFLPGQKYESYFDIFASKDNLIWESIFSKAASCNFSGDIQVFDFPAIKTGTEYSYIKLVGHGNSLNTLNSFSEFKTFGFLRQSAGLGNIDARKINIYPNPARDFINISIEDPTLVPKILKVIDLSGKIVFTDPIEQDIKNVQIPVNLKTGNYIVTLESSNLILYAQKLIINK